MKIINSNGFFPLVISGLTIATSPMVQTFKYNDLDQNNIQIKNENTQKHLNKTIESSYTDLLTKMKFIEHFEKWKNETKFLSSPNRIVENINFQEIIGIGAPVVKYIVEELHEEPSCLVWALNFIYGFKISDASTTTIREATKMWIRYLKA